MLRVTLWRPQAMDLSQHGNVRYFEIAIDMMDGHMQSETRRLARAGFPIRFLELGPVRHAFTPSFQEYLPQALECLRGADS